MVYECACAFTHEWVKDFMKKKPQKCACVIQPLCKLDLTYAENVLPSLNFIKNVPFNKLKVTNLSANCNSCFTMFISAGFYSPCTEQI